MPRIETHAPGSFNWIELATTDQSAAKQFYGALFGWQPEDLTFPFAGDHLIGFKLDGRFVALCYTIRPEGTEPPHWRLYVAVDDAEQAVARAAALGGAITRRVDLLPTRRIADINDPTGAAFSVWEAGSHIGTGITGENGALCWADLNTPDRERARAFYQALFGWSFDPGKDTSADPYLHIKNGETFIGGVPPEAHRNKHAPPHWLIYFQVADCDASTVKAAELGAQVYVPPMSIGAGLRYSVAADPQGAVFALFQGSA